MVVVEVFFFLSHAWHGFFRTVLINKSDLTGWSEKVRQGFCVWEAAVWWWWWCGLTIPHPRVIWFLFVLGGSLDASWVLRCYENRQTQDAATGKQTSLIAHTCSCLLSAGFLRDSCPGGQSESLPHRLLRHVVDILRTDGINQPLRAASALTEQSSSCKTR